MENETKHTKGPQDEMFDDIPRAPWKVTSVAETENKAFIWTDRPYPKGCCIAEVHAEYFGQLPNIARLIAAAPSLTVKLAALLEWAKGNRGRKDMNPYGVPEVKDALKLLARIEGFENVEKNYLDVNTKAIAEGR